MKLSSKIFLRIQSNFVGLQLANILDKNGKIEIILYLTYYDDAFAAIVAEINVDKDDESLNKKALDLTYDPRCVHF